MKIDIGFYNQDGNKLDNAGWSSLSDTIIEATLDAVDIIDKIESVKFANNFAVIDIGIGRAVVGFVSDKE